MIKGFLGKTHALMSIMLLCICLLIPIDFFKETIWLLKENIVFLVIGIIVTSGAALLPDLDNFQSSAGSTLGFMGGMFTSFMQSSANMIWSIAHTKKDRRPPTPHRFFWHTLVAGTGIMCLFWFGLPTGETKIIDEVKEKTIGTFLEENIVLLFFVLILFMAILCGSDMVLRRVIKWLKLPKALNYISPTAMCGYLLVIDYTHLRILGICIGLGYIFHCIEDCFADTGVPILWPLPIQGKCWRRIKFFKTCQTGGLANTILDLIVLVIDIGLIILILMKEKVI